MDNRNYEAFFFEYIDQIKDFLSPEVWQNILMDCSKNELFILWMLYRQHEVNMTQIADYICVPLNTATGVIARMEKRGLVYRARSEEDKRVVTVRMGEMGQIQMENVMKTLFYYLGEIMESFSKEEMDILMRCFNKVSDILSKEQVEKTEKKVKKITIM